MDNPKNESVLKIIERLRSDIDDFECLPAEFEIFLTVLELVDNIHSEPNHVTKTLSLIKTLKVSYSGISHSFNQRLESTNHTSVKVQSSDILKFSNYLKYFKSLESINMIDNKIGEDVVNDLAIAVLKNDNLHTVHLERNPIHKCFRLFETIRKMRTCGSSYFFKDCPETLEALINILKYISNFDNKTCDITENIEHLDISGFYKPEQTKRLYGIERIANPAAAKKISMGFVQHLKLFHRLKKLNLSNAYLTLDALQELSRFLCNNNTLLQLDISDNDIQAEGALIILNSLNTNSALTEVNLTINKITGKKCKEIATIICSLPNIKFDILRGNKFNEESKKILGLTGS